jgi:hypothetical protein
MAPFRMLRESDHASMRLREPRQRRLRVDSVAGDVEIPCDRDVHRIERAAARLALCSEHREPFADRFG